MRRVNLWVRPAWNRAFLGALLLGARLLIGGIAATPAWAQQHVSVLRMGQYNKAAEVTVKGTIQSIQAEDGTTLPRGTYLTLQASPLMLNVQMGLYSSASIPYKAGDTVSVTGSLMTINGTQILLARRVQSSTETVVVRSTNGFILRPQPAGQSPKAQGALQ